MGVKEQMIGILRDRDTARIRFTYTGGRTVTINRETFTRVADGLDSDHFHVVSGHFTENKIVYSSRREGELAANTFYLGNNQRWSRDFNALVVHEAVHAFFDLTRTEIPWVDNEAAAYIAQGYYLRNSGYPESRMEPGEPYRVGFLIAGTLANGVDASSMMGDLRTNLQNDSRYSSYIHGTFTGNG